MLAGLPGREVEIEVDFARSGMHEWVVDVLGVEEVSARSLVGVVDREINLKLQNGSLIEPLLHKINDMPL